MSGSYYFKLSEICDIATGKLDANAMVKDGKYPFFTCDRNPYRINEYAFDCECVLIGGNNANGNFPVNYYNGKFNAYQRTYVITKKEDSIINIKYIYYKIISELQKLKARSSGSVTKFITLGMLQNIKIPKMEKEYYDKIGEIIFTVENKINYNKLNEEKLNNYTNLLYHKWFVDFNFPNEEGLPYKNSGGELFELKGRKIPKGWKLISINEIVDKITTTENPQSKPKKTYKYYSIPVYDETKTYEETIGENIMSNKFLLKEDNLLISKLNPWFKRVVYPINIDYAICSTEFVVLKPLKDNILEYLYIIATSDRFTNYCTNASSGTSNSHKRVNPDYMIKYKIPYQKDIVEKFNGIVQPLVKKIHLLIEENKHLGATRDLLIRKLIK